MAYLRILRKGNGRYYYILRSERRGDKVTSRVLEYLGARPSKERLAAAKAYWNVKPKGRRG